MRQFFNTVYLLSKTHVDNIEEKVMSEAVLLVPSIVFAPDASVVVHRCVFGLHEKDGLQSAGF